MSNLYYRPSDIKNLTKESKLGGDPEEDYILRNKEERKEKERQYKEL